MRSPPTNRYRVANFTKAQPLFRCLARLGRGKVIPVSVLTRKIHYYRCIGFDGWRHPGGPRCDTRPVRQDLLDEDVWTEVIRLLEDPALIQQELDRRLAAAQAADPAKTRTQAVSLDRRSRPAESTRARRGGRFTWRRRIALVRGTPISSFGSVDLLVRDACGAPER